MTLLVNRGLAGSVRVQAHGMGTGVAREEESNILFSVLCGRTETSDLNSVIPYLPE